MNDETAGKLLALQGALRALENRKLSAKIKRDEARSALDRRQAALEEAECAIYDLLSLAEKEGCMDLNHWKDTRETKPVQGGPVTP